MNLVECQAAGTPVISTRYLAMEDYTRLGEAVPYRQKIYISSLGREMAMPDVPGLAEALRREHQLWRLGGSERRRVKSRKLFRGLTPSFLQKT